LKNIFAAAALLLVHVAAAAATEYEEDFRFAQQQIASRYAYFDLKATRWHEIPALYGPDAASVRSKREFVSFLERVVDELYDHHAQLRTNTPASPRLVPSGTDLWAEWRGATAVVIEVRRASDASRAGIRAGDEVRSINGAPIGQAVEARMGRTYPHSTAAARDWALRCVLAGIHDTARELEVERRGVRRTVELPARDQFRGSPEKRLTASRLPSGIGLIVINDSLGHRSAIDDFDEALARLRDAPALVIDLRDTPSGGNSTVARGILGRFVERETPYQKHVQPAEERDTGIRRSWLELVSPRGPFRFTKPVAILVDHWTGSMGEGLAIGFDAAAGATLVGTRMARLLGATETIALPKTGIAINVPAERLYHVNGTPRESIVASVDVDLAGTDPEEDVVLRKAVEVLNGRMR